jgi:protein-disulfide isomerase
MLPVSGLAAGAYLAMLFSSLFVGPATEAPVRRLAWRAIVILVGAAAGSAIWFILVQKWLVGAFCPYCTTTHIIGLLLATLVLWQAPKQIHNDTANVAALKPPKNTQSETRDQESPPASPQRVIRPQAAVGLAIAGLALSGILALCQTLTPPPSIYRDGETKTLQPTIDPHTVPLIGSPNAPHIVTLLFDYKCAHCQQLHFMLEEAVRQYHGKLAIVLSPSPLNTQCNPYIPRDVNEFKNSCELAKIGLAVWVAKREAFPVFDLWMFSIDSGDRWQARSLESAQAKAVELVGQAKLDAALAAPWVGQYLQTSIQTYGNTVQNGNNAIPRLIFGSRWVIPQPQDANDLMLILQNSLAVPKP